MPCGSTYSGNQDPGSITDTYILTTNSSAPTEYTVDRANTGPVAYSYAKGQCINDYHKRRNRGELLPYTNWEQCFITGAFVEGSNFERYDPSPGVWTTQDFQVAHGFNGYRWWIIPEELSTLLSDYSFDYEVQKAAAKIASSGHDTLTFLAELGKTREMFVSLLKRLLSGKFPKNARSIAEAWLEWRYGWRTLIYDLTDLNEAIQSLGELKTRYTERAGRQVRYTTSSEYVTPMSYQGQFTIYQYDEINLSVRGSVTADITPPKFSFNLAVTAWELVPWSFVLDWLLNVGQALSSMSFLALKRNYAAAGGYSLELTRTCRKEWTNKATNYSGSFNNSYQCTASYVRRIPTTVSYTPLVRLRLDEFKILDLIALISGRYK